MGCGACSNPVLILSNGGGIVGGSNINWVPTGDPTCTFYGCVQVNGVCDISGNIFEYGVPPEWWVSSLIRPDHQPPQSYWQAAAAGNVAWIKITSDCLTNTIEPSSATCTTTAPGNTNWVQVGQNSWEKWYTRALPCFPDCDGAGHSTYSYNCWGDFDPSVVGMPPCESSSSNSLSSDSSSSQSDSSSQSSGIVENSVVINDTTGPVTYIGDTGSHSNHVETIPGSYEVSIKNNTLVALEVTLTWYVMNQCGVTPYIPMTFILSPGVTQIEGPFTCYDISWLPAPS